MQATAQMATSGPTYAAVSKAKAVLSLNACPTHLAVGIAVNGTEGLHHDATGVVADGDDQASEPLDLLPIAADLGACELLTRG